MNKDMIEQNTQENQFGISLPHSLWRKELMPVIVGVAIVSSARIAGMIDEDLSVRDRLPEPFDVPDHIGNLAVTFVLADRVLNSYYGSSPEALTEDEYTQRTKRAAVAIGVLSVVANVVAEKVGYGSISTPDSLDFAYGLMGGALAYYALKPEYFAKEDINEIIETTPEESPSMQVIRRALILRQAKDGNHSRQEKTIKKPSVNQQAPNAIKPNGNLQKRNKSKAKMQKKSRKRNRK